MSFQLIGLLVAGVCITKAVAGLTAPGRFYAIRRRQYASEQRPRSIYVAPLATLALALAAWYELVTAGSSLLGWLITGFLTFVAAVGSVNLLRWDEHRRIVLAAMERQPDAARTVDLGILVLGCCFAVLAVTQST
jgi:hypothetical protein